MDEEWDTDNFKVKDPVPVAANKWEGEDEDDDVKDSWDAEEDEEEEKKDVEKPEPKKKTKKTLEEKIAEKERLRLEELERKMKEKEEEITPEERLRRQKESDLSIALETTFGFEGDSTNEVQAGTIDGMNPTTKEEFTEFSEILNKKLITLAKSPEFPAFAEDHIRNLCASLSSLDLKKLKTTIDNMYIEKQKVEKGDKAKKNKGKGKAKLRMEGDNVMNEYSAYGDYDEYDDFM